MKYKIVSVENYGKPFPAYCIYYRSSIWLQWGPVFKPPLYEESWVFNSKEAAQEAINQLIAGTNKWETT